MLYSEYLDYWLREYFEINYKYSTAKRYKESFGNIKRELGNYKLSAITSFCLNKALLRLYQTSTTKEALRNYQKIIKSSLRNATYYFGFIKYNPALTLRLPKMDIDKKDPKHLYTQEEIDKILFRFRYNDTFTELYKHFDKVKMGYGENDIADPKDMEEYYAKEEQEKYGVLGIEIAVVQKKKP